jgi:S-adenosylmethionine:tRNA ribosyltransferase-isomerase
MEDRSKCIPEMTTPKNISIKDFTYELPGEKIALRPLAQRDAAKLLVCKDGIISEDIYKNIDRHLPANSLLIFNNTKVIKARIRFQKQTGGIIEIFCLEPYEAISEYSMIMNKRESVKWKCMIGGAGKWKDGELEKQVAVGKRQLAIRAKLVEKLSDAYVVEFSWEPADLSFAEMIEQAGDIPLPPYIKRNAEAGDTERYQTIYAKDVGSVAAPTAGLHFTKDIFAGLAEKNIQTAFVTLHVGAGTFKPVKAATMREHEMHAEWIDVSIETIEQLLLNIDSPITAVGTTSLRTIESLYWMGIKVLLEPSLKPVRLGQWEVYEDHLVNKKITAKEALGELQAWMKKNDLTRLFTQTQILIAPGYQFKIVNALVTNFHQPQSTLLLLIAAAVGNDWKKIYDHALQHDFRFLSYGDGCLLFIN